MIYFMNMNVTTGEVTGPGVGRRNVSGVFSWSFSGGGIIIKEGIGRRTAVKAGRICDKKG